ncbi:MAG: alpha/beta hydrolase family esterase [Hyphomicrobiales bacterium]
MLVLTAEIPPVSAAPLEQLIRWAGSDRSYLVCLPPDYSVQQHSPLLLVFHGGGGNPGQVLKGSDIVDRAAREGWILVAPAGSGRMDRFLTWNVGFGFGYAMSANIDDIGFVGRLIEALKAAYRIDPDRIYATGISNGGILCHMLAGHLSDEIAAIAPIVATAGGRPRGKTDWVHPPLPKHAVSVISFNGRQDRSIPLAGGLQQRSWGEPVEVWSTQQTIDFWVRHDRCRPGPVFERSDAAQYERSVYSGGIEGSEVVQYMLLNQGHAWPGGKKGYLLGDEPTQLLSANSLMFEFFKKHPKSR